MKQMKKLLSVLLVLCLIFSLTCTALAAQKTDPTQTTGPTGATTPAAPAEPAKPCDGGDNCPSKAFKDVERGEDSWYHIPVDWAVTQDPFITDGIADDAFGPKDSCLRAQVVTFLWRAAKCPEPTAKECPFTDVKETDYFYKAVLWAYENKITDGMTDTTFGSNDTCTREQFVTFLWRFEKEPAPTIKENPFKDVGENYAYKAILWAYENKITDGVTEDTFGPKNLCTRAHVVTFLYRDLATGEVQEGKIIILHSNDVHGAIDGYAKMAGLRDQFVAEGADVILADAGDYCQGTTYVSVSKGANAIEMMNAVGYDVATLGNHEFDYGYESLMNVLKNAQFKVVCGDAFKDGKSIFDGWTIIEREGVKVGFVGLETPETYTKVNPGLIQGITFPQKAELYACAQALVDEVKAAGADIVIGLWHLGVDAESIGNQSADVLSHVTGVDFVIDGHSHTVMTPGDDGEFSSLSIQSTGTKFANIGAIEIDPATKSISSSYLVPVDDSVPANETVKATSDKIIAAVDAEYGAVFARSEVELNGAKAPNGNRDSETNNGDFITDAMLWSVLRGGDVKMSDGTVIPKENIVSITNGGGIRAAIKVGDVTMKDINTVLPFGNVVTVVFVKGSELLEALEASTFCTPKSGIGGFPQIAGMNITVAAYKDFDQGEQYPNSTYYGPKSIQRVTINDVNGKPFDETATYAVVTNDFCSAGGDTYFVFKAAADRFDTSVPMDEAVIEYVKEELGGVIGTQYAAPQGRITILTEAPGPAVTEPTQP